MGNYVEKRPEFQAVQFTGPASVDAIMKLCNPRRQNYQLEGEGSRLKLTICTEDHANMLHNHVLGRLDWFVVLPDFTPMTMTNEEFTDRFEPSPKMVAGGLINHDILRGMIPNNAPNRSPKPVGPPNEFFGDGDQRESLARHAPVTKI